MKPQPQLAEPELTEMLDQLAAKRSLAQGKKEECARLLASLGAKSAAKAASYICNFNEAVCKLFFDCAPLETSASVYEAIRENGEYKSNLKAKGAKLGFSAARSLVGSGSPLGKTVLFNTIKDFSKKGVLPQTSKKAFLEKFLDPSSIEALAKLVDESWEDAAFIEAFLALAREKSANAELLELLSEADERAKAKAEDLPLGKDSWPGETKAASPSSETSPVAKLSASFATFPASKPSNSSQASPSQQDTSSMLKRAQEAADEISKILKDLSERGQPEAKDSKIQELQAELSEKGEKISDLEKRLKTALEMDMSANSQEVLTLKNDIARSLEIEYENYKASQGKEYSKDMYEAHYASLFRIFRTLKRLGIKFE